MSQNCECDKPVVEVPVRGLKLALDQEALGSIGGIEPGADGTHLVTRDGKLVWEAMETGGQPGEGDYRQWESDWFDIAASTTRTFTHGLNLQTPWKCNARLVGRAKADGLTWRKDEILFGDGSNYAGQQTAIDIGWVIGLSTNEINVAFGNNVNFISIPRTGGFKNLAKSNVQCKVVFSY